MIYPQSIERCHEVINALQRQYLEQASRAAAAEMQRDAAVADVRRLEAQIGDLKTAAGIDEPTQPDDLIDDVFGEGGAL